MASETIDTIGVRGEREVATGTDSAKEVLTFDSSGGGGSASCRTRSHREFTASGGSSKSTHEVPFTIWSRTAWALLLYITSTLAG